MSRIHHVKKAMQRYKTVPKLDEHGEPVVTPVMRKNGTPKLTKRGAPVVLRVTVSDQSQPLPMPKCGKCSATIEVGQPYRWVKIKSGPYGGRTMYLCSTCPTWRQSELTTSKMAGIYAAQERCDDEVSDCEDIEALAELRDSLADEIGAVADEYDESAQNIEDGFGHEVSMSVELHEKADEIRAWAETIQGVDFDEFELDESEFPEEGDEGFEDFDPEDAEEQQREAWIDEQRDRLSDAVGDCPV